MIATREVKSAAPDGYTLLFSSLGRNVNPILLGEQAGFNPKTGQAVTTERRRVKIDYELPMKDSYGEFVLKLLAQTVVEKN